MTAISLRGLFSRKLRTILTMVAIILGVSMISGTYILTDTINASFANIFSTANRKTDAVISGKQSVSSQYSLPPTLPGSLLRAVRSTPGVAAAEGEIGDQVELFGPDNKQIGGNTGPSLLFSRPTIARFKTLTVVKGHEPTGREFALDEGTVNHYNLHLGEKIGIASQLPVEKFTLVGITHFAGVSSLGGAALVSMDLSTAQRITKKQGRYDQIAVAATPGISHAELVRRLKAVIPAGLRKTVQVKTSEQQAQSETDAIGSALNFLTIALLAFGGIAVFVGAFIIFNTFSITVAQRAREFAMLRTIGASRAQILRSVILEALVVGILASFIGLLCGIGIAQGINALFKAIGADLPSQGQVIAVRTVVVSLVVGTIVTLASGLIPAIRATQVPPIAALREGAHLPRGRWSRYVPYIALLLVALGIGLIAYGVFGSISQGNRRLLLIGGGGVATFLGVAMFSPKLIGPMASTLGWPVDRLTRITGRLARENAVRNPSRTAVTAAALMIGLALVGFVSVFAAELKQTASDAVDREIAGTYIIASSSNTSALIPGGIQRAIRRVPGVQSTSAVNVDTAKIAGVGSLQTNGVQPKSLGSLYNFQWKQGSAATLSSLGPHDAIIDDNLAKDHNLSVGSRLHITTPNGTHDTFRVTGIYKNTLFVPGWAIRHDTLARDFHQNQDEAVIVGAASGVNINALKTRLDNVLAKSFPLAKAESQQDIKDQNEKGVNQLLTLIYGLLAMSVRGLLLRHREHAGPLGVRAHPRDRDASALIGTTRKQVRWVIRWIERHHRGDGAILGLVLGVVFAFLITAGLSNQGIEYALPLGQLLIWVVFAIIFGIVAAAFPARRAARLDVLQAIAYE